MPMQTIRPQRGFSAPLSPSACPCSLPASGVAGSASDTVSMSTTDLFIARSRPPSPTQDTLRYFRVKISQPVDPPLQRTRKLCGPLFDNLKPELLPLFSGQICLLIDNHLCNQLASTSRHDLRLLNFYQKPFLLDNPHQKILEFP